MMSSPFSAEPIPLYYQLEGALRKKILNRTFLPGQSIPTELQLQEEYGVSRETVRKAVNNLVLAGLLTKNRGIGTFVAQPKLINRIGPIYSSTEEIIARGMVPRTKFIEKRELIPPEEIRNEMRIEGRTGVIKIKRLKYADNKPVAIFTSYLNKRLVPDILKSDLIDDSLYRTLEERYNLILFESDEVIEAGIIKGRDAKYLGLGRSGSVLIAKRLTYLSDSTVIEKMIAFYRSDRFRYEVKLRGRVGRLAEMKTFEKKKVM
jgi:GntR family transcriptional regulator